jgi:hypothetical protein
LQSPSTCNRRASTSGWRWNKRERLQWKTLSIEHIDGLHEIESQLSSLSIGSKKSLRFELYKGRTWIKPTSNLFSSWPRRASNWSTPSLIPWGGVSTKAEFYHIYWGPFSIYYYQ